MTSIRVVRRPPPPVEVAEPAARPLTHHEILTLIGPFTRRGRHADMAASRRAARRLLFEPIEHPPPAGGLPGLREVLELEVSERGGCRLTRTLTPTGPCASEDHLRATLTAAGRDPEALLEQIERFPLARHFARYDGVLLQRSYRLRPDGAGGGAGGAAAWPAVLTDAQAQVRGVKLEVDADRSRGMPIHLRLTPPAGRKLAIPQDLLAVIGWDWRPVDDYIRHWRGTIRVARREPARTADIEAKLGLTVSHLAETLSRPPAEFHRQHQGQRWRVALQRAIPLLVALGMIAATPLVRLLPMGEGSLLRMLVFHAPPLMLVAFFLFSELPRIEIPPLPRPLRQGGWLESKS
jgi:hypothetical protein